MQHNLYAEILQKISSYYFTLPNQSSTIYSLAGSVSKITEKLRKTGKHKGQTKFLMELPYSKIWSASIKNESPTTNFWTSLSSPKTPALNHPNPNKVKQRLNGDWSWLKSITSPAYSTSTSPREREARPTAKLEPSSKPLPLTQPLIYKFCEDQNLNPSQFEVQEQGLFYQGKKRIYFFDLFSFRKARGKIARGTTFSEIVYEEAIPIDQEILQREQFKLKDLIESLKRTEDQALKPDPHSLALEERTNPSLRNWDDFMVPIKTKQEKYKKYQILHALQDFYFIELGEREKNKKYALLHFSKNHKDTDSTLINFCFTPEELAK
ncbi:hypothetical protein BC938DRAFT_477095, partial [Jimgerdemannia flammicorona]